MLFFFYNQRDSEIVGLGMQILDPHHVPQLDYSTNLIIFWSCNHMEYLQLNFFLPAFWSSMSKNLLDTAQNEL